MSMTATTVEQQGCESGECFRDADVLLHAAEGISVVRAFCYLHLAELVATRTPLVVVKIGEVA